jgi:hypothetical protein
MHGGTARRGWRSPRWRHGLFSKYSAAAQIEAEARRTRRGARIERAITQKLVAWWASHPGAQAASLLAARQRIRREHLASLERRREEYRAAKNKLE